MAKNTKKFYQSKTLWASAATIVVGIGAYFTGEQELQEVLIVVLGAAFAYLRTISNSQVTK